MRIVVLAAIVLAIIGIGYALNNGAFVGTRVFQDQGTGGVYWYRECRYLFASGVVTRRLGGWLTEAEAENEACRLFLMN